MVDLRFLTMPILVVLVLVLIVILVLVWLSLVYIRSYIAAQKISRLNPWLIDSVEKSELHTMVNESGKPIQDPTLYAIKFLTRDRNPFGIRIFFYESHPDFSLLIDPESKAVRRVWVELELTAFWPTSLGEFLVPMTANFLRIVPLVTVQETIRKQNNKQIPWLDFMKT